MTGPRSDARLRSPDDILAEVAAAVSLQEGPAGVRSVVRALRALAPTSTRGISRHTGLPVPIVAAVANELRRRDLLGEERPSRLTPAGLALADQLGMAAPIDLDATCPRCAGHEVVIPPRLHQAVDRLAQIMADGPEADLALDQSLCTPETKVRRVVTLLRAGVLPGGSLLLVGDDDLISLAIAVVGDVLGSPLVDRLAVVDISERILDHIVAVSSELGVRVEAVQHDLRQPLPNQLRGQFDAAMTDPPYTPEGARLFLSRAVEGLRPGPAHSVFFSFGPKGPDELLEVQREIMDLGLVTNGFIRNFNEYRGSGILGGTGFLQHLLTTSATASALPASGYDGPLYTRDKRTRQREYECVACGERMPVGLGARWESVAALRAAGCPHCGGGPFRPRQLLPETAPPAQPAAQPATPPAQPAQPAAQAAQPARPETASQPEVAGVEDVVVRAADERDLPRLAEFEAEIARISFGEAAVDDPAKHEARLAKAMTRSRAGMYVACPAEGGPAVGWMWMSINQNAVTGERYANFRSLAVAPVPDRTAVAELLISTGLGFAAEHGVTEVVGKVHVGNVPMRALYRKFGFEATHLSMRLNRLPEAR
ncbi:GNAT family N-acetyltransferase [Goodfellowiella coeruleoviolacea]|uniref:Methyltransferase n=1 Tax=Goodfellowiella coeruleoviolacea TaxID=334858 RepID=A0AAE3GMC5_9PSEU|nr:GNAT family N-acetyltransferase [Goodfellowiella coeruleoviolacea]MCP2168628.1 putative methyltransferase [Goodfellowiella coeruleoviolacea]